MRVTFESVNRVKKIVGLRWVGLIPSAEGLNGTKRLNEGVASA